MMTIWKPSSAIWPVDEHRPWAGAGGLPTVHAVEAAVRAAHIIGAGARHVDARESYWHHSGGGTYNVADLQMGEALLLDAGIVTRQDDLLMPTALLSLITDGTHADAAALLTTQVLPPGPDLPDPDALATLIPDPARRAAFLAGRATKYDDTTRRLVGEVGEELVVAALRDQLVQLGHVALARQVNQLSLEDDSLGDDISAPRIGGGQRHVEVKATLGDHDPATVHLTHREADVGVADRDWFMVLCTEVDIEQRSASIAGYCTAGAFTSALPTDNLGGRWTAAEIRILRHQLADGLPPAV